MTSTIQPLLHVSNSSVVHVHSKVTTGNSGSNHYHVDYESYLFIFGLKIGAEVYNVCLYKSRKKGCFERRVGAYRLTALYLVTYVLPQRWCQFCPQRVSSYRAGKKAAPLQFAPRKNIDL